MYKSLIVFLLMFVSILAQAQQRDIRVRPKASVDELPFKVTASKVTTTRTLTVPEVSPESQANFGKLNLMDLAGKDVPTLEQGKVIVIELWNERSHGENLYWNRMRDVEATYAGRDDIEFISINYDYTRTGKVHLAAIQKFLKKNTAPKTLYLDKDDGFRSFFYVPGPLAYLLIDHRGQYIYGGRGDDPGTTILFDEHIENCLGYMEVLKNGSGPQITSENN